MKTNEAPEKLYFGECDKCGILDIYSKRESNDVVESLMPLLRRLVSG
jgi:hypothetical protein